MKHSTPIALAPSLASLLVLGLLACGEPSTVTTDATSAAPPAAERVAQDEPTASAAGWEELVPNARRPLPNLITGGQPTAEQLAAARDLGVTTVINLRTDTEPGTKAADSEALGLAYVSLPIRGPEDFTAENAELLADALAEAEGDVLLHCGSGNRVGALVALKAFHVDGSSAGEALELGLDAGLTRLEPAVREALGLPASGAEE